MGEGCVASGFEQMHLAAHGRRSAPRERKTLGGEYDEGRLHNEEFRATRIIEK
jgi:hypothetical protein